jgi:hypothetical protein
MLHKENPYRNIFAKVQLYLRSFCDKGGLNISAKRMICEESYFMKKLLFSLLVFFIAAPALSHACTACIYQTYGADGSGKIGVYQFCSLMADWPRSRATFVESHETSSNISTRDECDTSSAPPSCCVIYEMDVGIPAQVKVALKDIQADVDGNFVMDLCASNYINSICLPLVESGYFIALTSIPNTNPKKYNRKYARVTLIGIYTFEEGFGLASPPNDLGDPTKRNCPN